MPKKNIVEDIKESLTTRRKKEPPFTSKDLLSTGSTLLNLACSGRVQGGFVKGKVHLFVGDSSSGKTFICMTCLAESTINKNFDGYRMIYDNCEDGMLMDVERFFGPAVAERLEPPALKDGEPVFSNTVEEFYFNVDDACKKGQPFIYILDSMDALSDEDEQAKFQERKAANKKGRLSQVTGSYGTSKAKMNSAGIRIIRNAVQQLGSIIILISQTRDNIGFGAKFNPKTRAGGNAPKFYASIELWSSVKQEIRKTVKGKPRSLGITSQIKVKKNRLSGRLGSVEIPIYWSHGLDDVGSMVDWLVEEGHWAEKDKVISAVEWEQKLKREALVSYIEANGLEQELQSLVCELWNEIEQACSVQRKSRYV